MSAPEDNRYESIKQTRIEDHTEGYPQLAAYHSADPNFRIYRRFGTVRNRLILYKQWKITLLERELARLDVEDDILDNKRAMSIETDEQEHESRRSVALEKLDAALKQYDKLLLREKKMMSLRHPTPRNHLSVLNYIWNKKMIVEDEADYISHSDDLVSLAPEEDSYVQGLLEEYVFSLQVPFFQRIFSTSEQRAKTADPDVHLFDQSRVMALVKTLVVLISALLLLVSVILIVKYRNNGLPQTIILCVSVVLTTAAVSVWTKLRNYELFAFTAAYSAVLVAVFAGVNSSGE